MERTFSGAGVGGGGGDDFVTRPDTLRSNDTFEGLLGLCVGPIKGPVKGMQSVRINDTPIQDENEKDNFQNFSALFADGDPLKFPQKCTLRLGAAGAPDNIGLQLTNTNTSGPGPWITHTVNDLNADSIDLRFVVQQLFRQAEDGVFGTTLTLDIEMKPSGTTTWINPLGSNGATQPPWDPEGFNVFNLALRLFITRVGYVQSGSNATGGVFKISGKTTSSSYVVEYRVNVPKTGAYANKSWDIRVRLREKDTIDDDKNQTRRTISWESATAVYHGELGDNEEWRGFSWLQLYGKASDQLNGIPEVSGIYDTKIVSVPPPEVFDPETRQYTGAIWDGSWSKAFTTDPAWIINDAISDSLSGIARLVPGAHLNKWDALELSKYASELVPDGAGGLHPRFSLNLVVTEPQRSDDFIRYLAGACGGTAWDNGDGEWRCVIDRPQTPSALYTFENIEGEFIYSHSDVDTRFNDVTVVYLNEEFDYREDRIRLEDTDHIARFGRKPTKIVAIGCTNRQQALRWGILKLRTNINEFRNVSFTTNRQGKMLERFAWILVADSSLNQSIDEIKRTTGRIVENKGGSIVLRDTVRLESGVSYELKVTAPNPAYDPDSTTSPTDPTWQQPTVTVTRSITNLNTARGDVRELFLDTPLPADIAENANVALSAPGLPSVPKVYRIVDLNYDDAGEKVSVSAIEVDTGKFLASDLGEYDFNIPGYDTPSALLPPPVPPSGGLLSLVQVTDTPTSTRRALRADWLRPSYPLIKGYRVERRFNDGPWIDLGFTTQLESELVDPPDGFHEYRVYTVDQKDRESLPLEDNIAIGALPQFAPVGVLTNESHTVATAADGTGFDLSGAGGQFILYSPGGQIVEDMVFSVEAADGATATIDANGVYTITDLTADAATVTFRAVWFDYTIDKIYSITKSKAGLNAPLMYVISDRQTVSYDGAGGPSPPTQTTTFTAQKVNTTAAVTWSVTDIDGTAVDASAALSATTGNQVTMTEAQFATAHNGTGGVIVKATLTDGGVTLSDRISVIRVHSGADGAAGASLVAVPTIIYCDSAGIPRSGELPKRVNFKFVVGGTDVSALATWADPAAVTDLAVAKVGGGAYDVSAISADKASFEVTAAYAGVTLTISQEVSKLRAGADAQTTSVALGQPTTSYAPASPTISMNVYPGNIINMSFGCTYDMNILGSGRVQAKFMYRNVTDAGAWTQVGTELIGSSAARVETSPGEQDATMGACSGSSTVSAPSAQKIYEFRIDWVRTNNLTVFGPVLNVAMS
jgi:hypothetical protein